MLNRCWRPMIVNLKFRKGSFPILVFTVLAQVWPHDSARHASQEEDEEAAARRRQVAAPVLSSGSLVFTLQLYSSCNYQYLKYLFVRRQKVLW